MLAELPGIPELLRPRPRPDRGADVPRERPPAAQRRHRSRTVLRALGGQLRPGRPVRPVRRRDRRGGRVRRPGRRPGPATRRQQQDRRRARLAVGPRGVRCVACAAVLHLAAGRQPARLGRRAGLRGLHGAAAGALQHAARRRAAVAVRQGVLRRRARSGGRADRRPAPAALAAVRRRLVVGTADRRAVGGVRGAADGEPAADDLAQDRAGPDPSRPARAGAGRSGVRAARRRTLPRPDGDRRAATCCSCRSRSTASSGSNGTPRPGTCRPGSGAPWRGRRARRGGWACGRRCGAGSRAARGTWRARSSVRTIRPAPPRPALRRTVPRPGAASDRGRARLGLRRR